MFVALALLSSIGACKFGKHQLPYPGTQIVGTDTAYHELPEFRFYNQDSTAITREDLLGKVVVADFFFISCPTICPVMGKHMKMIYDRYPDGVQLISHSIDTRHDTIPRLKAYAQKMGVNDQRWHFVTGDRDEIYRVGQEFYMVSASADPSEPGGYLHSGSLILLDQKGRIRGIYDGTNEAQVGQLISDIKILLRA